ncbi:hypothetical protein NT01EI_3297 [Edwardsiella ictaluri 93-146]|uniref:Uncharacterized protein n=1 Tax=Edwardsiella ictaluri (strain 93-146) TaxID=634503 RepID=C5B909_EDWI9|nr:hypothetical protein NT01EI_3297 [Edwardsiella ictaluri 93-146]
MINYYSTTLITNSLTGHLFVSPAADIYQDILCRVNGAVSGVA